MMAGADDLTVDTAFQKAVQAYGRGDIVTAKAALTRIAASYGQYAPAFNALAIIALDEGSLDSAADHAQRAIELDPTLGKAWNTLGSILLRQGNVDGAENHFQRAIALNPLSAEGNANLGQLLMVQGKPAAAVEFYARAVELKPSSWHFSFNLGLALEQAGRVDDAEAALLQAFELNPGMADVCLNIGALRVRRKDFASAEQWFRRAVEISPNFPPAWHNLGNILAETGRRREAVEAYRHAIRLDPQNLAACVSVGEVLDELNRSEEAVDALGQALTLQGDHLPALIAMSHALRKLRRFEEAGACIERALSLAPDSVHALNALATLYINRRRYAEAASVLAKALKIAPLSVKTLTNLGFMYILSGKAADAVTTLQKAAALDPDSPLVFCNLGMAFMKLENTAEALAAYEQSLALDPGYPLARINMTVLLNRAGNVVGALEALEELLNEGFESEGLFSNLGGCLCLLARPDEAVAAARKALSLNPETSEAHSNILYAMNFSEQFSAEEMYRESIAWDRAFAAPQPLPPIGPPTAKRRLRVGYVSPDFREHSVSYFCSSLFACHDREKVEIYCYADVPRPDGMTAQLRATADCWRDVSGMSDYDLAQLIRSDNVDILVDLAGHTDGNRLRMFTLKPAPVQVTWLGYPATTGLSSMDYRITDAVADPEGDADTHHTEKLVRLPDGFLCYSPPPEAPEVSPPPSDKNGYITFGSFNNPAKMVRETVRLWGAVLRQLSGSRLILKNRMFTEEKARQLFLDRLAAEGVGAERITFVSYSTTTEEHLGCYASIDISLDTFPYHGTTTTCEALWMGVPVVTLMGDRHAARVGGSILTRLGLEELIARTPEEFTAAAVALAADREGLREIRRTLRQRMHVSPLCAPQSFARQMEAAYMQMWNEVIGRST